MIDLHCHILPGLDDGALDLQDSIAMARQAQSDGVAVVCATPHVRHDHTVEIDEIAERVSILQAALDERGIEVRVLPGGELAQTQLHMLRDAQLHRIALGGNGGWVLLEPAPGPISDRLEQAVDELAERGLSVVIAHPERHAGEDFTERLLGLASRGCAIQWTAEFIAASPPGEFVMGLAADGLVHLLGSDAHSSHGGREVRLAAGYERLATVRTPEQMRWTIETAPRAIVEAKPLSRPW